MTENKKNSKEMLPSSGAKGFTLIELLVVIAIIGLLASLSLVALNSAREKARNSRRVSDVNQIKTALELKYSTDNEYPDSDELEFDGTGQLEADNGTVYMDSIPSNPAPRDDGECPDENYSYSSENVNQTYSIQYCISEATGGVPAGRHTATPAGVASGSW